MAFVGLLAAGCSSTAEPRVSPTVQTAPQTAAPTTPVPPTAATTVATSTTRTPTSAAASSAEADRAEIARVLEATDREYQAQRVLRLFDASKYEYATESFVADNQALLTEYWAVKRAEFGSVLEYRVIEVQVDGDKAIALSCVRNDIQVFNTAGTTDLGDDRLIDGNLTTSGQLFTLERRNGSWLVSDAIEGDTSQCQSAFAS
jgi:hypothetical protein